MDVNYETDNFTSNHSLKPKYYNSLFVKYSKDKSSQLMIQSENDTYYLDTDSHNWENISREVYDGRLFRHNLKWTITLVFAYTLIYFVGIVGNCVVILVFIKRSQMRTVTNMFITNLAVADLLVIIICLPAELLLNIFWPWMPGSIMCKAVPYLTKVSVCASAYSLTAISLDRCIAIYRPSMPPRGLSKRQAIITICLIWTIAMLLTIPRVVPRKVVVVNQISFCFEMWDELFGKISFLSVFLFFFYCLPLILIFISNIIIWWNVSKRKFPERSASASRIDRMHRETRQSVGKMLGVVTLAFLVSWLPLYVLLTKAQFIKKLSRLEKDILKPIALLLGFSNSSINPILYAFLNKKFREMFKSLLPKWVPCIHNSENTIVKSNMCLEQL